MEEEDSLTPAEEAELLLAIADFTKPTTEEVLALYLQPRRYTWNRELKEP
jgi:hypothetical protein